VSDFLERLQVALEDRYAVETEIGRGGMATVFLAEDLKHHRKVAIKVLYPELAAAVGTDRFLREIETVAGLTHPHVLPLHDSGETDGLLFYIMPYVEGESLRQRLEREKQLPVDEALRIAREVADALDHAHRHGVVHRDVKPGNILMVEGHAVVTDFGVARAISEAGGEKITATGLAVGTPAYMSPEQASGERDLDVRSDIYALGCVLYEMLAGEPPLTGATPTATAAKRVTDRPTPLGAMRSTVPEKLESLVEKTLAVSPADRPATARQLAKELAKLRGKAEPAARTSRAGRWLVRVIGLAAIAMLAAIMWLLATDRSMTQQVRLVPAGADDLGAFSIAVLPFVNMSADPEQEYFSDGISEELLNLLAKIPEMRVTSRFSSFSFKGQTLEIPEIARRLNVAHILDGSVRKAGNEVRITVQLIDARSDTHLWAETWDRSLEDIFAIQEEIAADVAEQLKVTLLGVAPTLEETDPAAYALYLQARQLARPFTAEGFEQSNALYQQVLEIDSGYAAAWAGLAENYEYQASFALRPFDEGYELAREAANRALAIDPEYAPAYASLGLIASDYDGDLAAAARHFERALELEPTSPENITDATTLARSLGRLDEAIALNEYSVARDPVNSAGHFRLGVAYLWAGRLDEAIASFRTVLTLNPGASGAQSNIGVALLLKGEPEAALAAIQQESSEVWRLIGLVMAHHALGQAAESDTALEEVIKKYEQGWAYNIAYVLAFRGEADLAFEWLEKAVEYHDPGLSVIEGHGLLANIHDDPRWLPFLESIGKSPEQLAAIEFEVRLPQ
jgi:TolB-like protein/lipoprotein NlpI/tRNA A-37 threonylcarbamoyl transferase component Bud32